MFGNKKVDPTIPNNKHPYKARSHAIDPSMHKALGQLRAACGTQIEVLIKPRMAELVTPRRALSNREWNNAYEAVRGRSADFALCRSADMEIVAAVMLEKPGKEKSKRRELRQRFVRTVCEAAKLPLLSIPASTLEDPAALQAFLVEAKMIETETTQDCPSCGKDMRRHQLKKGKHVGRWFWICSDYPSCKKAIPV